MRVYYNEIDKFAAAWLRGLMAEGLIAHGDVDERSIRDVRPDDLAGYSRCHFFAGIAGWEYALQLAGWPDDAEIWTGSCPCQPFSVAGKRGGTADDRHLWPDFWRLIAARRPAVVMGEQVGGSLGYGWLDGVRFDLEGGGYACEAVDVPACAVNAPHRRNRIYWLAEDVDHGASVLGDGDDHRQSQQGRIVADQRGRTRDSNPWSRHGWIVGYDGKARRVTEPGICLLAHGIPNRVGALRGFGNAIVPELAAEVVKAFMETRGLTC